jgi:co-chaperonin GroES (HSP10)
VKRIEEQETARNGIIVPDSAKEIRAPKRLKDNE